MKTGFLTSILVLLLGATVVPAAEATTYDLYYLVRNYGVGVEDQRGTVHGGGQGGRRRRQ